jgi:hypothetical protein
LKPWHFERQVRNDLRHRRWLRLHVSLIGALTFAVAWATSHALMLAHVERLSLRYGMAFVACYAALMVLLYVWARWLLSRHEADLDIPQFDGGGSGGTPAPHGPAPIEPGGGGDFGGGGASGSFDGVGDVIGEGVSQGAGDLVSAAADVVGAADEAAIVLIPLAVVLGAAAALGTLLGFAVFGLFGVEVLLGVAVEIAFASVGGALAFKAQREGWLGAALRHTVGPAAAVLIAVVALGAAVDYWLPQAHSLPHAVRLLRA